MSTPLHAIDLQAERDRALTADDQHLVNRLHYGLQLAVGKVLFRSPANADFYPNIAFSHHCFLTLLRDARTLLETLGIEQPTFLDVGCGLGVTLLLAEAVGFRAHGLDCCRKYVAVAREMMQQVPGRVFHANALTFPRYGTFDCIYWYNPIRNAGLEKQLEQSICAQARTPCVFVLACDNGFLEDPHLHRVPAPCSGALYLKCRDDDWSKIQDSSAARPRR